MAALIGLKPSSTRSAAQIAMGTPKPAAPSRNAPKQKAIRMTWIRWSAEIVVMLPRMTSNIPLSTASL
ncbi:hypothetical protein [Aureimonas sp. Leaf324]|uniref:hypothetical protein n=1 Tax=Aureimonas sp. Leaf324 TaxID=1736336 RepID=UPI001FCD547D|nr:hypothetical protein [Aureimonas sp. Leaf324]